MGRISQFDEKNNALLAYIRHKRVAMEHCYDEQPTVALVMPLPWQLSSVARPRNLGHRPAAGHTLYGQRFADDHAHFSLLLADDMCCHLATRACN